MKPRVYFSHPEVLTDERMVRLSPLRVSEPIESFDQFQNAWLYYIGQLVEDAFLYGENVDALLQTYLNCPAPPYPGDVREDFQALNSRIVSQTLTRFERMRLVERTFQHVSAVAEAVLASGAGQAFLLDVATNFNEVTEEDCRNRHRMAIDVALAGAAENDSEAHEVATEQAVMAEHHEDLTFHKFLESLSLYLDR